MAALHGRSEAGDTIRRAAVAGKFYPGSAPLLRSEVAEFPHAWIKTKLGIRQFRLRGLVKVGLEAIWACLTYNIQQWIRLSWRQKWVSLAG